MEVFEIDIFLKTDLNGSLSVAKRGFHILHPFEGADGTFNRDHRLVFHIFRINFLAGGDLHIQHWKGGVRHQFHRQLLVREVPQQGHSQEQHADKNLSIDDKPHLVNLLAN